MDKHFFKLGFWGIGTFLATIALFSVAVMFLWNERLFALSSIKKDGTLCRN
jgi:hypothetical protein